MSIIIRKRYTRLASFLLPTEERELLEEVKNKKTSRAYSKRR